MTPPEKHDSTSPRIAAVVFDLDGTLVDSSKIKLGAYFEAINRHAGGGREAQEMAYSLHGTLNRVQQLNRAFADIVGRAPSGKETAMMVATYTAYYGEQCHTIHTIGGFKELCTKLSSYRLAIASNAPQEEVAELCQQLGILNVFERLYGYPTSKVDALRTLIADWNLGPSQILYVGDRPEDRSAADAAGTQFRLIDHTGSAPYGTDSLVSSFFELSGAIERLASATEL